ncbi:MAG: ABC transporter permease [Armatimonadetes bacterium]|nr:ABC transporter permease [Armatimonadota bacterium]
MSRTAFLARFREAGILFFLLAVAALTGLKTPRFFTAENFRNILLDIPLLVVVAMGMTLIIISRNIDLSVGSILGLSAILVGMAFRNHPGLPIAVAMGMGAGIGLILGAINGLLVARIRIPAIIATLATLSIYRGLVFIVSDGKQIDGKDLPDTLLALSQPSPVGIPAIVLLALLVALVTHLFLRMQRAGRDIYAAGSNPAAARLRGVPVDRTLFLVFTLTGGLSGLAGVMYASRFGFVNPGQTGTGFELSVIAAVVIGGANVFGGSGSVPGALLGCLLLGVVNNALTITGLSATWQLAVYGAIILAAASADSLIRSGLREGA